MISKIRIIQIHGKSSESNNSLVMNLNVEFEPHGYVVKKLNNHLVFRLLQSFDKRLQ